MEDFEARGDDASASDASEDGAGEGRGGAADAGASSDDEGGRAAGPAAPGAQRPGLRPGKREAAAAGRARRRDRVRGGAGGPGARAAAARSGRMVAAAVWQFAVRAGARVWPARGSGCSCCGAGRCVVGRPRIDALRAALSCAGRCGGDSGGVSEGGCWFQRAGVWLLLSLRAQPKFEQRCILRPGSGRTSYLHYEQRAASMCACQGIPVRIVTERCELAAVHQQVVTASGLH